jgi:hypothetical protein
MTSIGSNTLLANATASAAVPTALAIPSCSGAANALTWTTATGFGCNNISSSVSITAGNTGIVVSPSPITGTGTVSLGNPSATTLGGVESIAAVSHQFLTTISTSGVPSLAQPAFTDISGNITLAQMTSIGSNTLLANATASAAVPTALAIPSCSGAANALTWTTATGFGCNNISSSGSGTVNSGTQYQIGYYATTGTAISGGTGVTTDASNDLTATGYVSSGTVFKIGTVTVFQGSGQSISIGSGTPTPSSIGNVALGYQALQYQSGGFGNTGMGSQALQNVSGNDNTGVGLNTESASSFSGSDNTIIGATSGKITTGSHNLLIGFGVGTTTPLQTGSSNILIGDSTVDTPTTSTSNFLDIGNLIFGTSIGTTGLGAVAIGTTSGVSGSTLTVAGHVGFYQASGPVVSSCGGGTLVTGSTDNKGQITGISAATACTITFNKALPAAPSCTFSSNAAIVPTITSLSTTAVTTAMTALTGTLYYQCF